MQAATPLARPSAQQGLTASPALTVLMPCLNEARTLARCIGNARRFLDRAGLDGEILVADNGSTDGSQDIARANGARVVDVPSRGYGAALLGGIEAARGRYVVMGDADDSYAFEDLDAFVEALRAGHQLVMGNRFKGGIQRGAMPALHRWLGNPVLSWLGQRIYKCPVGDFHCGLRGFERDAILKLRLRCSGMEFASEMLMRASFAGLRICEVPTTLRPDGRGRPPHLHSWRDGWRHLRLMLLYSPAWLFALPGAWLLTIGVLGQLSLLPGAMLLGPVGLDIHSLLVCACASIVGLQLVLFGLLAKLYGVQQGLLPPSRAVTTLAEVIPIEVGLIAGLGLIVAGGVLGGSAWSAWSAGGLGALDPSIGMRLVIPAVTMLVAGTQVAFSSMFAGVLTLERHQVVSAAPEAAAAPRSSAAS